MHRYAVDHARGQFSALQTNFAYLDAPGGSQVPDRVADRVGWALRSCGGNLGAPYATSRRIATVVTDARTAAARFLGCAPEEISFGPNMTTLNFALTRAVARTFAPGDEIVVTRLDHDGNVAPWLKVAEDLGLAVKVADLTGDLGLDHDHLRAIVSERTRVIAFPWASNALGTIVDAEAVCRLAREAGALAWIDAVHYAAHRPIDVSALGADVVLCSAYKFCGPHLGIAYVRRELAETLTPYGVRPQLPGPLGGRFETGCQPYELLAGFVECVEYMTDERARGAVPYEDSLTAQFLSGVPDGVEIYGPLEAERRLPTFLFNVHGHAAADVARSLAARDLGVWHGREYYALGLSERLPYSGEAVRAGFMHYTTPDEVDRLLEGLAAIVAGEAAESP